jgi:5'-deoxynucleotidase YfbR-like HD superfamily hydrolase
MTVDPTDPETFNDQFRQILDAEAPEAAAAEQVTELDPVDDVDAQPAGDPLNANEADLAEQARVVRLNEDDYR